MDGILGMVIAGTIAAASPADMCRVYRVDAPSDYEMPVLAIENDKITYHSEDVGDIQLTCDQSTCVGPDGLSLQVAGEKPGEFIMVDGERWNAACQ